MVYKRDRQTCNFKAIKHRWCTRETDKHEKLSSTDGDTHVSGGLGTIGHVVGSGHKYINSQYMLVPTRSITK